MSADESLPSFKKKKKSHILQTFYILNISKTAKTKNLNRLFSVQNVQRVSPAVTNGKNSCSGRKMAPRLLGALVLTVLCPSI